jgi:3-hydroxyacyl-[acyl-carrier-protein] dehydratase
MALGDFYRVIKIELQGDNSYKAGTELNKNHPIYNGHFPGNPVVPGVCLVQMLKDLVSQILGKQMMLCQAGNIKFLEVVNPNVHSLILWEIKLSPETNGEIEVRSIAFCEDKTCFKFSGKFK